MKTFPLNKVPYSAALYLRKCEEKKTNKITIFERVYRGAYLTVAGIAAVAACGAVLEIAFILAK